jgi:hypothetical protein
VLDRRSTPRIGGPFPAVVLNMGGFDQRLGQQATLEELSASGFYLRLPQRVEAGERLMVVTQVAQALVVLCGAVARVEELAEGAYGLAVVIARHQIFSLKTQPKKAQLAPLPWLSS